MTRNRQLLRVLVVGSQQQCFFFQKFLLVVVVSCSILTIYSISRAWNRTALPKSISSSYYPTTTRKEEDPHHHHHHPPARLSLQLTELPGYTGWARPAETQASLYQILQVDRDISVGQEWKATVQCRHRCHRCRHKNAHFYLRLYGPAVWTGTVTKEDAAKNADDDDVGCCLYTFRALVLDPGVYTVEVVLAFSDAPAVTELPLPLEGPMEEPGYEGYFLPGFPLRLTVHDDSSSPAHHNNSNNDDSNKTSTTPKLMPTCGFSDLVEQDVTGRSRNARWVVTDKVTSHHHRYSVATTCSNTTNTSLLLPSLLDGYRQGRNALGVEMEYRPRTCHLLPLPTTVEEATKCLAVASNNNNNKEYPSVSTPPPPPMQIIFVGDSNLRVQRNFFRHQVLATTASSRTSSSSSNQKTVTTFIISTSGSITAKYSQVVQALSQLVQDYPSNTRRFVLFNTGLHDISLLCSQKWQERRAEILNGTDDDNNDDDEAFSCVDEYTRQLTRLVQFMADYPAELRVFQSTTAGWMKYGNFGFAWPPNETQPFPLSPNVVDYFNTVAYQVIQKHNAQSPVTISIMDGYWITLSRPDNREVKRDNSMGPHLVHPGLEVLRALVQIWYMLLLNSVSSECLLE